MNSPLKDFVNLIFSCSLLLNALLFIPQAIKVLKEKESKNLSLITYIGFLGIQFMTVLHGILINDWLLVGGYIFSMITCGTVILLAIIYRNKNGK